MMKQQQQRLAQWVVRFLLEWPLQFLLCLVQELERSELVHELGRCMARCLAYLINQTLENPITQEKIAYTIHLGMCQFLNHPEKLADIYPILARKHGEDFPKIIANFFAGLLQSPITTKKQPPPQEDVRNSQQQPEQSPSPSSTEVGSSATRQNQTSKTLLKNHQDDASIDIPELLIATPEQDLYASCIMTPTKNSVFSLTSSSSSTKTLRALKSFPSFRKSNCQDSLDHSFHNSNHDDNIDNRTHLQMRSMELEEYFDAVDIAQFI